MFARLLLIFTIIPLIELMILITIGSKVGVLPTVLLVIVTALVGISLARYQGLSTLSRIRHSLSAGRIPAEELLDGLFILVAAILLIAPGILTDITGILLLIPFTRNNFKKWLKSKMQDWINRGGGSVNFKIGF